MVGTTKFRTLTLFANCDDFINWSSACKPGSHIVVTGLKLLLPGLNNFATILKDPMETKTNDHQRLKET